ncbi:multiple antibiotic resistance regulatory protein MarB, partial [Salmonella enterica subsp. enterica serovar Bareilly]
MKLLSSAMLALLLVVSGQSVAEQSAQPTTTNSRDTMIVPTSQEQSPFDFN